MNVESVDGSPYLFGAASLLEDLDKDVLLVLRDGRHLVGILRSLDQYLNLVLEDTYERVLLPGKYCDVPLGLYIVRGDNIVLCGALDRSIGDNPNFQKITPEQLSSLSEETTLQVDGEKLPWDFEG